jgi:anti-anti-sigma factor
MDVTVIEYDGGIDEFPLLIQTVDNLVADGCRHLVVDLAPLPFINSAALGYLIKVSKTLQAVGGGFALARVQPAILNVIDLANLAPLFPSYPTVEAAVKSLGGDLHSPGGDPDSQAAGVKRRSLGGSSGRRERS